MVELKKIGFGVYNVFLRGELVAQYYEETGNVCPIVSYSEADAAAIEAATGAKFTATPPPGFPEQLDDDSEQDD